MFKINTMKNGISATLTGFKKEDITAKIEACQEGSCECACDPEVMKKIENIEISGSDNETHITVTGNIDADTIAPMMQECLLNNNKEK
ncbi:MAG: hypothetical protein PF439_01750 [Helicobacteraceae bacterium]|jgi:hypothetical protein|nr:hypothetical protein [Helicobacteraceae bacterium]